MAIHLILGWRCKTKDCEQFHAAKYLGELEKVEGTAIPLNVQGKMFSIPCPRCHERHDYRVREIRSMEVDAPPPAEFRDVF